MFRINKEKLNGWKPINNDFCDNFVFKICKCNRPKLIYTSFNSFRDKNYNAWILMWKDPALHTKKLSNNIGDIYINNIPIFFIK